MGKGKHMAIREWDELKTADSEVRQAYIDGRDTGTEHIRQEVRRMVEEIIEKTWYDYDVAPAQMDEVRLALLHLGRYMGGFVRLKSNAEVEEDAQRLVEKYERLMGEEVAQRWEAVEEKSRRTGRAAAQSGVTA